MIRPLLSLALACLLALPAQAAERHSHHYRQFHSHRTEGLSWARPRAWCGWWMRQQFGGGPELNLARNWAHVGHPSAPHEGAIVVWAHHVGFITGRAANGSWIVKSGNDGGRVRERARSLAGVIAVRER
jgi:hypothetical protein